MVKHFETVVMTKDEYCYSYMGEEVKKMVAESGIRNGIVSVITAHTNCGILVTEPLPCIMSDLDVLLHKLVDDDAQYSHAHFLPTYGQRIRPSAFDPDWQQLHVPDRRRQNGHGRGAGDRFHGV